MKISADGAEARGRAPTVKPKAAPGRITAVKDAISKRQFAGNDVTSDSHSDLQVQALTDFNKINEVERADQKASVFIFFRGLVEGRRSSGPWAKAQSDACRGQR